MKCCDCYPVHLFTCFLKSLILQFLNRTPCNVLIIKQQIKRSTYSVQKTYEQPTHNSSDSVVAALYDYI